jgi:hypothetical protein
MRKWRNRDYLLMSHFFIVAVLGNLSNERGFEITSQCFFCDISGRMATLYNEEAMKFEC